MLILGIAIALFGFIISYKGVFACRYEILNPLFFMIAYLIAVWFDTLEQKLISLILTSIIVLLFHSVIKSLFRTSKNKYIVFNIRTNELLDVIAQIIKEENIKYQRIDNSILLDSPDNKAIKVKSNILDISVLSLSNISDANLSTIIEEKLDIILNQPSYKKFPLLGTLLLFTGLAMIIMFYATIL